MRSHRVGKKTEDRSAPRDIIVRFTTHNTKTAVMRKARKLKGTHLFITDDMPRSRATIAEAGTEDPGHVDWRRHHLREGRRECCEVFRDSANVEGLHPHTVTYPRCLS